MKKALLITLLIAVWSHAQDSLRVNFLVNLGINASYVSGAACQKYEPHRYPGLHMAFTVERKNKFSDYVGIEIAYEKRGGS
ncbi:hypothetical protein ACX8XP_06015 [Calditrichota bacterium LG25]